MVSFVVDESLLQRLSPGARREFLNLIAGDLTLVQESVVDQEWDPDGEISYPLSVDEARQLIRSLSGSGRMLLRAFCLDDGSEVGKADLGELLQAGDFSEHDELGQEVSHITLRLQTVSGLSNAWLFNWHPEDWEWDDVAKRYIRGAYFISGPAVTALRSAFSMGSDDNGGG